MGVSNIFFPLLFFSMHFVDAVSAEGVHAKLDDFGPNTCIPGWQGPNDDADKEGDVISGWGNCHDPEIGLKNAEKKMCAISLIDATTGETDYRCTCSHMWALYGPDCEDHHPDLVPILLIWSVTMLLNFVEFYRAVGIARFMYNFAGKKFNAANSSAMLITVGLFSEGCRYLSYVLRTTPGSYGDETFELFLIFAPISAVCITEAYMGLGLAWLDIAVKSSARGGYNKTYKLRKVSEDEVTHCEIKWHNY